MPRAVPSLCSSLPADAPCAAVAEAFAKGDPYVTGGLVGSYDVVDWTVVVDGTAGGPGARGSGSGGGEQLR